MPVAMTLSGLDIYSSCLTTAEDRSLSARRRASYRARPLAFLLLYRIPFDTPRAWKKADTVRAIFRRYVDLKSVRLLQQHLAAAGIVSKHHRAADGRAYSGRPIARGGLYLMLQNRIYCGEIVHKNKSYPGEHAAIVGPQLWDGAQATLKANRVERDTGAGSRQPSLFADLLFDAPGAPITPSHAVKKGVRYRYDVSRVLVRRHGETAAAGQRLPAAGLEVLVTGRLRA